MGNVRQKRSKRRAKSRVLQHKLSILSISAIIVLLAVVLSAGSISLQKKNKAYKAQQAQLQTQLKEEEKRAEEIDALEEYVGTDEYIEDVAKEKLGLINPNEILFKAEP